jgi:alkanesulfonate monooxygenase SsuD/methylene tetrahydromethanopterin reductase-like flavin-dependent oxidoreductase (luciferase family)
MKIGVMLPQYGPSRWGDMLEGARAAETLGFDSVWLEDHLLVRVDGEPDAGPWECWTALAALAASTSRVELGVMVSATVFRNPALLAKIATTVDEISGGRLILGMGAGWHQPELHAYGYPADHLISRFDEALRIVVGLLRTGRADLHGTYYDVIDCRLLPQGPRPDGLPVLVGGKGPRMLRLVAEYADSWNVWATWRDGAFVPPWQGNALDAACHAAGRDPTTLGRTVGVVVRTPFAESDEGVPTERILRGDQPAIAASLREAADAGIDHVQVLPLPTSVESIRWFAPVLEHVR